MTEADEVAALLEAAQIETEAQELDPSSDTDFYDALKRYTDLRNQLDKLSAAKKTVEEAVDKLSQVLVPVFEARRLKSIRIAGIGLISTAANNNPKVVDQERLFQWLEDQGEAGLIKRTLNYMTLKGFLNERVEDKKDLPPTDVCELTSGRILKLSREKVS